jgi:nicotinate-nucleotide--dimethylbenzimidazole phosphoribosyltransferase
MTANPLNDIRTLIATLPGPDEQARAEAAAALVQPGAHGRLEETALWLAAWSGKARPALRRPILALYAGAPGPARLEVSEQRRAQLEAIAAGQAQVSRMAQSLGAGLEAFDLAIDRPIGDAAVGAALGEREAAATMAFGMEVLAKQPDLLLLGEVGGEADSARALFDALGAREGLEALRALGTREIAAVAGAILGARIQKVPVILDGFGPAVAALAVRTLDPTAADHCRLAQPVEGIDIPAILDLGIGASDGTAALAALSVVKLAGAVLSPAG